jgi:hypothetical protein
MGIQANYGRIGMKSIHILRNDHDKAAFINTVRNAQFAKPVKITAEYVRSTRSLEQNKKIHAMLRDISRQVEWAGKKRSVEDWKDLVTAALKQAEIVEGLEGGLVALGLHTSRMTIGEMTDMIDFMYAWGNERGVRWTDDG